VVDQKNIRKRRMREKTPAGTVEKGRIFGAETRDRGGRRRLSGTEAQDLRIVKSKTTEMG